MGCGKSIPRTCVEGCPVWQRAGFSPDGERFLHLLLQDQLPKVGGDLGAKGHGWGAVSAGPQPLAGCPPARSAPHLAQLLPLELPQVLHLLRQVLLLLLPSFGGHPPPPLRLWGEKRGRYTHPQHPCGGVWGNKPPGTAHPLACPCSPPTHNGQGWGARPVVGLDLGGLVGVWGLCRRELGGFDDQILYGMLPVVGAGMVLCGAEGGVRQRPGVPCPVGQTPPLTFLPVNRRLLVYVELRRVSLCEKKGDWGLGMALKRCLPGPPGLHWGSGCRGGGSAGVPGVPGRWKCCTLLRPELLPWREGGCWALPGVRFSSHSRMTCGQAGLVSSESPAIRHRPLLLLGDPHGHPRAGARGVGTHLRRWRRRDGFGRQGALQKARSNLFQQLHICPLGPLYPRGFPLPAPPKN